MASHNALVRALQQFFIKSASEIEDAVDTFDPGTDMTATADYHMIPSRNKVKVGRPGSASGSGAEQMVRQYSEPARQNGISADYSEFDKTVMGQFITTLKGKIKEAKAALLKAELADIGHEATSKATHLEHAKKLLNLAKDMLSKMQQLEDEDEDESNDWSERSEAEAEKAMKSLRAAEARFERLSKAPLAVPPEMAPGFANGNLQAMQSLTPAEAVQHIMRSAAGQPPHELARMLMKSDAALTQVEALEMAKAAAAQTPLQRISNQIALDVLEGHLSEADGFKASALAQQFGLTTSFDDEGKPRLHPSDFYHNLSTAPDTVKRYFGVAAADVPPLRTR